MQSESPRDGDLSGRSVLITGANSGLGLETARVLGGRGASIILAVRDVAKGEAAAARIDGPTEVRALDLASLTSVRTFATDWGDRPLDVLINNAGVMYTPQLRTEDGFELQIGTNHLGHFTLTNLLLANVRDRVVTVASVAHRAGRVDLADLNWERRRYNFFLAYNQSKLANLLFSAELSRRLVAAGSPVRALSAHPGYAATNLTSHSGSAIKNALMKLSDLTVAQSARMGAMPTVYAATEDIPADSYVGPAGLGELRGHPKLVGRTRAARNPEAAAGLWTLSEQLTGVSFGLPGG